MNIIFDQNVAKQLSEKCTVLELDTIIQPNMNEPITLYAVVEINNLQELATLTFFKEMHSDMIREYKSSNWIRAVELISGLKGQFGGELDSFYENILDFCEESAKVNRIWDGIRLTVPKE